MSITAQHTKNLKTRIALFISALLLGAALGGAFGFVYEKNRLIGGWQTVFTDVLLATAIQNVGLCGGGPIPIFQNAEALCRWHAQVGHYKEVQEFGAGPVFRTFVIWPAGGALVLVLSLIAVSRAVSASTGA